MKDAMPDKDTRIENSKRFHLALSFFRHYTPGGKRRSAPLTSDMILRALLSKNSYERPGQLDDMRDAIFKDSVSEVRATVLGNKLRKNALLPEAVVEMFGRGEWSAEERAEKTREVKNYYRKHFRKAYKDYEAWKKNPSKYLDYVDAFVAIDSEKMEVKAGQTALVGVLDSDHPQQRELVGSSPGSRTKQ
jgi:hypothetical protein